MNKGNNVIGFPKKIEGQDVTVNAQLDLTETKKKIDDNVEMMKLYHITQVLEFLGSLLFTQMEISGFSVFEDNTDNIKDRALMLEAIRSVMNKQHGLYHPLQDVANNLLIEVAPDEEDDPNEGQGFKMADSLNIEFKKTEKSDIDNN